MEKSSWRWPAFMPNRGRLSMPAKAEDRSESWLKCWTKRRARNEGIASHHYPAAEEIHRFAGAYYPLRWRSRRGQIIRPVVEVFSVLHALPGRKMSAPTQNLPGTEALTDTDQPGAHPARTGEVQ